MLWHDDRYYVLGYSERHGKIVKFRVDRIAKAEATDIPSVKEPADFGPVSYLKNIIAMYDGRMERVRLKCEADMMKVIIDCFGADVYTESLENGVFPLCTAAKGQCLLYYPADRTSAK